MNAQDRKDIKELSDEFKGFVKEWYKKQEDVAKFHATMKEKISTVKTNLKETKQDHEKRIRVLEKGERKTIVIASLVGAVVTGGGGLLLLYLSTVL